MKRGYDADPAWSRGSTVKKKRKMVSRASLRLLTSLAKKKRAADKGKGIVKTICRTRTVELPSTQTIGEERSKLLFMLALGLLPNYNNNRNQTCPLIKIERLDRDVEAEAKARTKQVVFEIFQMRRRQMEIIHKNSQIHITHRLRIPSQNDRAPHASITDRVELVDLVSDDSDDDESCANLSDEDSGMEIPIDPSLINGAYRTTIHGRQVSTGGSSICHSAENVRIITSSPHRFQRKPVFKPLLNNPPESSGIFRNWKPESMTRLMNLPRNNEEQNTKGNQSKLLSSIKSATTLTVRQFSSNLSAGGSCKSHINEAREDNSSSSSSGVSELDYIGPTTIITID